jgi:hypothetical protein
MIVKPAAVHADVSPTKGLMIRVRILDAVSEYDR